MPQELSLAGSGLVPKPEGRIRSHPAIDTERPSDAGGRVCRVWYLFPSREVTMLRLQQSR